MKFKLLFIPLLLIVFLSFFSCTNNSEEGLYGDDCDTLNMTYSKVKYIFQDNCYICHTVPQGSSMIKLDSYSDVKDAVNTGKLLPAIKHKGKWDMPLNQDKLSDCQIAKIEAWIHAGMPE